jgi:hypothetical protein
LLPLHQLGARGPIEPSQPLITGRLLQHEIENFLYVRLKQRTEPFSSYERPLIHATARLRRLESPDFEETGPGPQEIRKLTDGAISIRSAVRANVPVKAGAAEGDPLALHLSLYDLPQLVRQVIQEPGVGDDQVPYFLPRGGGDYQGGAVLALPHAHVGVNHRPAQDVPDALPGYGELED